MRGWLAVSPREVKISGCVAHCPMDLYTVRLFLNRFGVYETEEKLIVINMKALPRVKSQYRDQTQFDSVVAFADVRKCARTSFTEGITSRNLVSISFGGRYRMYRTQGKG